MTSKVGLPDASVDLAAADELSTDGLVDAYEHELDKERQARVARITLGRILANRAPLLSQAHTSRLCGERRQVKIERPPDSWDQQKLRFVWDAFPQYARDYLRIERLAPQLIQTKKLLGMVGPDEFMRFRAELLAANKGQIRAANVIIER